MNATVLFLRLFNIFYELFRSIFPGFKVSKIVENGVTFVFISRCSYYFSPVNISLVITSRVRTFIIINTILIAHRQRALFNSNKSTCITYPITYRVLTAQLLTVTSQDSKWHKFAQETDEWVLLVCTTPGPYRHPCFAD